MQRFDQRTVVVTGGGGGGGGIGGATCRRFGAAGASVAVFDLNLDAAEAVARCVQASDDAAYITGQVLSVSGGLTMTG